MTHLLNEEELKEKIYDILNTSESYQPELIDLINEQKVAHADMVIGTDEPGYSATNQLRYEQRQRNK